MILKKLALGLSVAALLSLTACGGGPNSHTTNWKYNDSKWGGFEVRPYKGMATPPGLVLIEGGTFVMGATEEDLVFEHDNFRRRVSVASFYLDEFEVSNVAYREYLYWTKRTYSESYPEVYRGSLPDTLVWRSELSYNEPYVTMYLRHPSYNNYPVVGVSWHQANDYAKWRTDRVNEQYLIDNKVLEVNYDQYDDDVFTTESYRNRQYEGVVRKGGLVKDFDPSMGEKAERHIRLEDGILVPDYRLPTEAEWEYAALGLIANHVDQKTQEMISDQHLYPWLGNTTREQRHGGWQGKFLANFKRGRGDYGGLAGNLNDNALLTAPVGAYMPNGYGLYNMAGNVNEWVFDVYRKLTSEDVNDFNPARGMQFETLIMEDGEIAEVDSLGRLQYRLQTDSAIADRRNYSDANAIDFWDGDSISEVEYAYADKTLTSNFTRVYKGGGWMDEAYWIVPGTRRYLEETQSRADIGFRCAMARLGGDVNNIIKGGNYFRETSKIKKQNAKKRKFTN